MLEGIWQALGVVFMATDLPIFTWPVTLAALIAAIISGRQLVKSQRMRAMPVTLVITSSLAAFLILPLFAVAYWADHGLDTPKSQELPGTILVMLWCIYVIALIVAVGISKGYRIAVAGFLSLPLWCNFAIFFVCSMAVSGVWL